ncbi:DUF2851 family protein [Gramella sp. AN32]|uniref:DUF2851 family protein n=1 Tax=Christiangramia antarctica TaxID=2058158 RepID=A0ABW5X7T4_9FLAO|nr:DUF2851 family protein [Gramella sp. AN32]MCM4154658.1 DUF2851 domain-containing protein [Gramella sp. AN32]
MKEELLYHIWKFKKFHWEAAFTVTNEALHIIHPGSQNSLAGPDFFNAKIKIGGQLWAGNVEIHSKASHWYAHHHEIDQQYDNVILHVVWEMDAEIFRKDQSVIPTLVLKPLVNPELLENYKELLKRKHSKINCEKDFGSFSGFQISHWLERLYFERLELKFSEIQLMLDEHSNHWEQVFFIQLFKSFGLNHNGLFFAEVAKAIGVKTVQKLAGDQFAMEALFLGMANLITGEDQYAQDLKKEFQYLKSKFSLKEVSLVKAQFFRLRPDNFPTIRLVQLAAIFAKNSGLFRKIMEAESILAIYKILDIEVCAYWKEHYNFGKNHPPKKKKLSKKFMDLIIINGIVPIRYAYSKSFDKHIDLSQNLLEKLPSEKNAIIDLFEGLRPNTSQNAMNSQALIHLKRNYCDRNNCLHCELGASLLRKSF